MKPDFNTVFWIVHEEAFKPKIAKDWLDKKIEDDLEYIRYQKIIPVYVKAVSDLYDGTTEFCITPVDVRDGKTKYWQWSRSIQDKDIGVTVFETEEDAAAYFEKTYSEEMRKKFAEKHQFRMLQQ